MVVGGVVRFGYSGLSGCVVVVSDVQWVGVSGFSG